MKTVEIFVKANCHVKEDVKIAVQIDKTNLDRLNEISLRFPNGDYGSISMQDYRQVAWYLTTYEEVYAVQNFIQGLKDGSITIDGED